MGELQRVSRPSTSGAAPARAPVRSGAYCRLARGAREPSGRGAYAGGGRRSAPGGARPRTLAHKGLWNS